MRVGDVSFVRWANLELAELARGLVPTDVRGTPIAVEMSADELEGRASSLGASAIGNVMRGESMAGRFSEPPALDDLARLTGSAGPSPGITSM